MTKFRDQQGRIHRLGDGGERFRGSRHSRNAAPAPSTFDGHSIDEKLAEIGEIIDELAFPGAERPHHRHRPD